MRVAVDATPLIGPRTGVGRYVEQLTGAVCELSDDVRLVLTGITARGGAAIPRDGLWEVVARPFPARLARQLWSRGAPFPPAEWFAGRHDVFHATNFVLPPLLSARGVVTVHDLAWLRFPSTVAQASQALRYLVPRAVSRAALTLVPSRAVAELAAEHLPVTPDRIRVTPLGVDRAWFDATADPNLARRLGLPERYVAVVATQEPRKNLAFLLSAHREAAAASPDTPALVLVGGRGWGAEIEIVGDRVRRTGYLPDAELRSVLAGAGALAMPSLDEGFGLPVLEAFAAGVSVLAADLPVLREVSGGLAFFADPRDRQAWTELLADPPAAEPSRLRRWAQAWTWQRCAEATVSAYREAAAG